MIQRVVMTGGEKRAVAAMAGLYGVRMLGLFMLLPVLALYADSMAGATPLLVGLAVGVYGLTQALLQIPFGMASDRYGRRVVLVSGLLVFAAGGLVAAVSDHIAGVIAGRALQGAGAISAVLTALLADLTRADVRTRAMAIVGATIGTSFLVSIVLGPALAAWLGVPGLFTVTAALGIVAAAAVLFYAPAGTPPVASVPGGLRDALRDRRLLELDFGIFALHFVLALLFVALPFALRDVAGIAEAQHWRFYLTVIVISIVGTVLLIRAVERSADPGRVTGLAVLCLIVALLALALFARDAVGMGLAVVVFFAGFNYLEARLPAEVSEAAPPERRGAALGVYASAQFLGVFAGGSAAGLAMAAVPARAVFVIGALLAAVWLGVRLRLFSGARSTNP